MKHRGNVHRDYPRPRNAPTAHTLGKAVDGGLTITF